MKDEKVLRIPGRYDRGQRANRKRSLKFTKDRNERQSGKTDEKPAKRREIDCSVFLELCIVLRDHGGLAQLGERVLCKHEVIGSSPIFSTIIWADSSAG